MSIPISTRNEGSTYEDHSGRVSVVTVEVDRHVDVQQISVFQGSRIRNAVTKTFVDRRADAFRKLPIIQRRGISAVIDDHFVDLLVDGIRRDAGLGQGCRKF